jgi:hypothetical protein
MPVTAVSVAASSEPGALLLAGVAAVAAQSGVTASVMSRATRTRGASRFMGEWFPPTYPPLRG